MLQCGKTLNANKYHNSHHQQQQQQSSQQLQQQQYQQNLIQKQQQQYQIQSQSPQHLQSQSNTQLQLKTIQQNKVFSPATTNNNMVANKNLNINSLTSMTGASTAAAAVSDLSAVVNFNLPLISKQLYNENGDNIEQNKLHLIDYDEI